MTSIGDAKSLRETSSEIWWVMILAMLIIYMTLAAQFESLVHPFTVMLAVPLAGIGAFGLLYLVNLAGKTGVLPPVPAMNINLFSLIGLILLVGLVTKNSILLVEFANQRVAAGALPDVAMLEAGHARLRPILMTAFATIAGILPIAIGFGAGAESRRPLGVAVVGGMLSSTFLTLYVIPVIYTRLSALTSRPRIEEVPVAAATATTSATPAEAKVGLMGRAWKSEVVAGMIARIALPFEIDLNETDRAKAEAQVKAMCEKLIANTVIENYDIELA